MSKQDWEFVEARRRDWVRGLTSVMGSGAVGDAGAAMDLAEDHRRMLAEFMGECGFEPHRRIAELYPSEPAQLDFLVHPDEWHPGMSEFLLAAVRAKRGAGLLTILPTAGCRRPARRAWDGGNRCR